MADSEILRRADSASGLLANETFQEAVEQIRQWLDATRRNSKLGETDIRERAYQCELCLDLIVGNLDSFVNEGVLVRDNLKKIETESPWNLPDWRKLF